METVKISETSYEVKLGEICDKVPANLLVEDIEDGVFTKVSLVIAGIESNYTKFPKNSSFENKDLAIGFMRGTFRQELGMMRGELMSVAGTLHQKQCSENTFTAYIEDLCYKVPIKLHSKYDGKNLHSDLCVGEFVTNSWDLIGTIHDIHNLGDALGKFIKEVDESENKILEKIYEFTLSLK